MIEREWEIARIVLPANTMEAQRERQAVILVLQATTQRVLRVPHVQNASLANTRQQVLLASTNAETVLRVKNSQARQRRAQIVQVGSM